MFKRSINFPQIYQSLTPGKTIVISFLSNNVISSMKCLWRQQIRTTSWSNVHNVHEICLKKKIIRCDVHLDRQYTGFGNYVEQFDVCNARVLK